MVVELIDLWYATRWIFRWVWGFFAIKTSYDDSRGSLYSTSLCSTSFIDHFNSFSLHFFLLILVGWDHPVSSHCNGPHALYISMPSPLFLFIFAELNFSCSTLVSLDSEQIKPEFQLCPQGISLLMHITSTHDLSELVTLGGGPVGHVPKS